MFVTVNVSFNAYACHEVHFVAKFIWSRTYVTKSSRPEVTFHLKWDTLIYDPRILDRSQFLVTLTNKSFLNKSDREY